MSIGDLVWLFFIFTAVQPMLRQQMLEAMRVRKISQIEQERKSRVILLVHRQETMRLLGFPVAGYIDINDSEDVLRAIQMTDVDVPLDLVLHTPGGLVLAALQIAKAVREHKARVTVFVPHYAMSGGTLIALAADEIVMCEHSVLGPIDPQLGESPAASLIAVVDKKPIAKVDDRTLILADVGRKAIAQVKQAAAELLTPPTERRAGRRAGREARIWHLDPRLPNLGVDREVALPADQHQHAGSGLSTAEALSAASSHPERRRRRIFAGAASKPTREPYERASIDLHPSIMRALRCPRAFPNQLVRSGASSCLPRPMTTATRNFWRAALTPANETRRWADILRVWRANASRDASASNKSSHSEPDCYGPRVRRAMRLTSSPLDGEER